MLPYLFLGHHTSNPSHHSNLYHLAKYKEKQKTINVKYSSTKIYSEEMCCYFVLLVLMLEQHCLFYHPEREAIK